MNKSQGKYRPGDRVRVRFEDRAGHLRTPWYVRGKTGWIERVYGEFLNPESLAFGRNGLPKKVLYSVGFEQAELWGKAHPGDKLWVDIYEHWLDPLDPHRSEV